MMQLLIIGLYYYIYFIYLIMSLRRTQVHTPDAPDNYAFKGMSSFVWAEMRANTLAQQMVSRQEYLENGHHYCNKKFFNSW